MQKTNITAIDVALLAGVSQSTVSRVFTPGASVSQEKRRLVLEAAKELGYHPNAIARGLITNKTYMVGLVMGETGNPFYPEVLGKFSKGLRKRGYHVLFVNTEKDDVQHDEIEQFFEYNVDGVIVTDATLSSSLTSNFLQNEVPVVLFNRYIEDSPCSIVCCNNYLSGKKIGEYLLESGHHRLAYIAGRENTSTSQDRQRGFKEVLAKHGYELMREVGHYTYEGGYAAAVRLLQSPEPPDGIFCANDIMALGAIDAAKQLGIHVPEEVSIIGFDDITSASWSSYSLTTWQQPVDDMVDAAIDLLSNEMAKEKSEPVTELFMGKLIERTSVMNRRIN
ncbi:LacI family DNA-binding transcriptional regulator [Aneurinibacillus tyrosinisolvens]|uniref:LacI family DNA-binding transcriptional regulator n=1 Tax=Aneurinibacillus tyrosinisolvens TaxID=1443435 RepID=UPI00063FBCFB|nr:LacI family DNA-binding transcriptional regulator [Aneurinibacillus tyrosinisolvens]